MIFMVIYKYITVNVIYRSIFLDSINTFLPLIIKYIHNYATMFQDFALFADDTFVIKN